MSDADATPACLEVAGLSGARGPATLFEGLAFQLDAGQALLVYGRNGSGKTSLLRILAGLSLPAAGQVFWRGVPGCPWRSEERRELLYLGHTVPLRPELSVVENLKAQLVFDGVREGRETLFAALDTVGLVERRDLPARYLSLGQRRRLGLARVALARRALWLLDEPATGLDVAGVAVLENVLRGHLASGGLVVLTSHQPLEIPGPVATLTL